MTPKTVIFMNISGLIGFHSNIVAKTTNSNLPFNIASRMYHYGVILVFLDLIIRKI